MALVRYNPLFRWPSVFEDEDLLSLNQASNNLDVYETEDEVIVKANVAGIDPESVEVTFEKGVLWITAKNEASEEDQDKQYYSRSSWNYSYKVAVPGMLDLVQEPAAEVDKGVITISFKKAAASKPKKLQVRSKQN